MTTPLRPCTATVQERIDHVGTALGAALPYCAAVTIDIAGTIVATAIDSERTTHVMEITAQGEIYRSMYCAPKTPTCDKDVCTVPEATCASVSRVKQSGTIALDKLAAAKKIILGKK